MRGSSVEGFYSNFRAWFNDVLAGANDVIESADRMGLTDSQKRALQAEASLYENLAKLLDSGKSSVAPPTPVARHIVDEVQARLDRWVTRSQEAEEMDLNPAQRGDLDRTKEAVSALKAYIASFPVADQ